MEILPTTSEVSALARNNTYLPRGKCRTRSRTSTDGGAQTLLAFGYGQGKSCVCSSYVGLTFQQHSALPEKTDVNAGTAVSADDDDAGCSTYLKDRRLCHSTTYICPCAAHVGCIRSWYRRGGRAQRTGECSVHTYVAPCGMLTVIRSLSLRTKSRP